MKKNNVIYDERIPRLKTKPTEVKTNRRFVILILLFFLLIVCILYFQSPLSKLQLVDIEGLDLLQEEQILGQAELSLGIPFFQISISKIEDKLRVLTEIEQVEVKRKFPNKLHIQINEYPIVCLWYEKNKLFPVLANGYILMHRPWEDKQVNLPILNGWPNKDGLMELSKELTKLPLHVRNYISEIGLTPIISDPYRLTLYMTDGFEVRTSIRDFAENMNWYPHYVQLAKQEGEHEGVFYLLEGKWFESPELQGPKEEPLEGDT